MIRWHGRRGQKRTLPWCVRHYEESNPSLQVRVSTLNVEDAKEAIELTKLVRSFARKFLGI